MTFDRLAGTSLYPRADILIVTCARKPIGSHANVTACVLSKGCGGINIDGSRIPAGGDNLNGGAYAENATPRAGLDLWSGDRKGDTKVFQRGKEHAGEFVAPSGRWPANLVLMHGAGCQNTGTKQVKPQNGSGVTVDGANGVHTQYVGGVKKDWLQGPDRLQRVGADGTESVTAWVCEPGCPVAELDRQSARMGVHPAGNTNPMNHQISNTIYLPTGLKPISNNPNYHNDTGTASRYFKQMQAKAPKYCPT